MNKQNGVKKRRRNQSHKKNVFELAKYCHNIDDFI